MSSLFRKARAQYDDYGLFTLLVSSAKYVIRSVMILIGCKLGSVLPRRTGLVLFHNKYEYSGNSRYIFEWIVESNHDSLDPHWLTHSLKLYLESKKEGKPVVYTYSPKGLYYFARAAVFCYDRQHYYYFPDSVDVFCVSHEIPVKRGHIRPTNNDSQENTEEVESKDTEDTEIDSITGNKDYIYDHVLYPSEFLLKDSIEGANVNVVTLGFPRNDALVNVEEKTRNRWRDYLNTQKPDTVILYAPSRRRFTYDTDVDLFPFADFNLDSLNNMLEKNNALLLLRLHPRDENNATTYSTRHNFENLHKFIQNLTQHRRIRYAGTGKFPQTTDILPFVDILISDYSTIYHTFLFLDRPLMFFSYDYETVYQTEGFKYEYYENLPGPAITSFTDFQTHLLDLFKGTDPHRAERHRLRNKLYENQDGKATQRVASFIEQLALGSGT